MLDRLLTRHSRSRSVLAPKPVPTPQLTPPRSKTSLAWVSQPPPRLAITHSLPFCYASPNASPRPQTPHPQPSPTTLPPILFPSAMLLQTWAKPSQAKTGGFSGEDFSHSSIHPSRKILTMLTGTRILILVQFLRGDFHQLPPPAGQAQHTCEADQTKANQVIPPPR